MKQLRQPLGPPHFEDPELNRQAGWLHQYLVAFTGAILILFLYLPWVSLTPGQRTFSYLAIGIILGNNLLSYYLVHRGQIKVAGWLFSIVTQIFITAIIAIFDGIRSSIVVGYFVIVSVVSLYLAGRATMLFLVLNIVSLTAVFLAEKFNLIQTSLDPPVTFDDLLILILGLILNTILLRQLIAGIADSGERARAAAAALHASNEELKASQTSLQQLRDELEIQVQQRTTELLTANTKLQKEIAERKEAEQALRTSQNRLQAVLANAPLSVWQVDKDGRLIYAAGQAGPQFQDEGSIIGQSIFNLLPQELSHVHEQFPATLTGDLTYAEIQVQDYILEAHFMPVVDRTGAPEGIIGVTIDVTERKKTEAAMRQTQKLESLGLMAGGVAHDFNNLLVAMLAQTSLAKIKIASDHPAYEHLEKAIQAAESATDLTRQMLAYSGGGQQKNEFINLNELILKNTHLFQAAIPKNVILTTNLSSNLPAIAGDPSQLQQVIMNLILNGAEAIGERSGQVLLTTGVHTLTTEERQFWRWTGEPLAPGKYIVVTVEDDGIGMDSETLPKIFDPFFTTKSVGHGLGLAAVLGIVRGHQGGLNVQSEAGWGTTFTLLFPAQPDNSPPKVVSVAQTATSSNQTGTVLVIDDEKPVRDAVTEILELDGFQVITAGSGQAGIDIFEAQQNEIDLIILDLSMPGLNGYETFHQLRELNTTVKIILSSGYHQNQATDRFLNDDLAAFLQKPYGLDTLRNVVRQHLQA